MSGPDTIEKVIGTNAEQGVLVLTKREMIAAMCLQGFLANAEALRGAYAVESAVEYADMLLSALSKEKTNG